MASKAKARTSIEEVLSNENKMTQQNKHIVFTSQTENDSAFQIDESSDEEENNRKQKDKSNKNNNNNSSNKSGDSTMKIALNVPHLKVTAATVGENSWNEIAPGIFIADDRSKKRKSGPV